MDKSVSATLSREGRKMKFARRIIIAGAGIGGLTTALVLHSHGIDSLVLESAEELQPIGVGINIQPSAVGILFRLGFEKELKTIGIPTARHQYIDDKGMIKFVENRGILGGNEFPQYSVHRGELQMMLLKAVEDRLGRSAIVIGDRVNRFEDKDDFVEVNSSKTTYLGSALIGADGFKSVIRQILHPGDSSFYYSGVSMWRGVTEIDSFLDGKTMLLANDRKGTRVIAYPISSRYQEKGKELLNWVCLVPNSKLRKRWNVMVSPAEVIPFIEDWSIDYFDVKQIVKESSKILYYPMVDRNPLISWGEGLVTLLGDSAHPMFPIGANGASQAIIDAESIGYHISRNANDLVTAFSEYENQRRPATTQIVEANRVMDNGERGIAASSSMAENLGGSIAEITEEYRKIVDLNSGKW